MPWTEAIVPLMSCVVVLGFPGVLIGLGFRLRGLWLAAATPVLGATAIFVAAFVAGQIGLGWSVWPVLLVALAGALVAYLLTSLPAFRSTRPAAGEWRTLAVALSLAVVIIGVRLVFAIHSPDLFAQTFDNVFHLNAVRLILDLGDASPSAIAGLNSPSGGRLYPSGWHALSALIVQVSGSSIPVASNAALFVVSCLVWPLGGLVLARTLFGAGRALLLSVGVLAGAFGAFPFLPISLGGAYPLVYSIALIPVVLAAILETCNLSCVRLGGFLAAVLFIAMMPGVLGAHPSAAIAIAVLSAPVAVVVTIREWRAESLSSKRRVFVLALIAYLLAVLAAVVFVRPPGDAGSPSAGTLGQAIGEALTASMGGQPIAAVIAVMSLAGAVAVFRHGSAPSFAALGLCITWLIIYVLAAGNDEFLRLLFTGPWYTDPTRIAAIAPVVVLPVAAYGSAYVWRSLEAWLRHRGWLIGRGAEVATALVAIAILIATTQGAAVRISAQSAQNVFIPTDNLFLALISVSQDEREVIARAESIVPDDDLIAGNPWSGSSFAYALIGRRVLFPHLLMEHNPVADEFMNGFAAARTGDSACDAARELGVRWVFDFPSDTGSLPTAPQYPGLEGLDRSSNVELVEQVGNAALYRVVGCGI